MPFGSFVCVFYNKAHTGAGLNYLGMIRVEVYSFDEIWFSVTITFDISLDSLVNQEIHIIFTTSLNYKRINMKINKIDVDQSRLLPIIAVTFILSFDSLYGFIASQQKAVNLDHLFLQDTSTWTWQQIDSLFKGECLP